MITLYGSATSPNVLKVRNMMQAAGIPYTEHRVKREEGENRTPEFLQISANGTLPAIVDDETGARVFESSAILLYLGDRSGKFYPSDPAKRADVMKWLVFEAANISPAIEAVYKLYYREGDWVAPAIEFHKEKLSNSIEVVDRRLHHAEFLADECSIADFALFPVTLLLEDFLERPLSDFPDLTRWGERMQAFINSESEKDQAANT
jgi:GST-like protein